ncbi:hypothetical protein J7L06_02495 [Candidatus Bathyarchaeota archaeon]|nr:hypothetical protein [Candidatus Bathyarchaeota archaeon]
MRIAEVVGMIALVVSLLVAVIIGGNLQTTINNLGLTGTANSTAYQVFSNMWSGLQLASIGIIIAAAVGIIALVLSAFTRPPEG